MRKEKLDRAIEALEDPVLGECVRRYLRAAEQSPAAFGGEGTEQSLGRLVSLMKGLMAKPVCAGEGEEGDIGSFLCASEEISGLVAGIVRTSSSNTVYTLSLESYVKSGLVLHPWLGEICCAAGRDGLLVDYETLRADILFGRQPKSNHERAALEAYRLSLSAFLDEGGLRDCAKDLDELLGVAESLEGADPPRRRTAYRTDAVALRGPLFHIEKLMDTIECEMEHARTHRIPPLIKLLGLCDEIIEYRPFGPLSAMMETIVRTRLLNDVGLRGLFGVPISKLSLAWEQGLIPEDMLVVPLGHEHPRIGEGFDDTFFYQQKLRLVDVGLKELEETVSGALARSESALMRVRQDHRLNHRQKSCLAAFLGQRDRTFDSACYCAAYDCTPVTSRSDLNQLVRLGFLFQTYSGRKALYRLRPDFEAALA